METVPTSATKHLTSPWRVQNDKLLASPRYLQHSSWREREGTAPLSPVTSYKYSKSPWNKTGSNNPSCVSQSPLKSPDTISWRRKGLTASPAPVAQYQHTISPWNKTGQNNSGSLSNSTWNKSDNRRPFQTSTWGRIESSSASQAPASPWVRTRMSPLPVPGMPAKQSLDRSQLTSEVGPNQGDVRPRLQLQIPGQPAGGEQIPTSRLSVSQFPNATAGVYVPQQASKPSHVASPNNNDFQETPASTSEAATRLPANAGLAEGLPRGPSNRLHKGTPTGIIAQGQDAIHTHITGGSENLWYTEPSPLFGSSAHSDNPHSARREQYSSDMQAEGSAMHTQLPSAAGQVPAATVAQIHELSQVDQGVLAGDPMPNARQQAFGSNDARVGGPSRRGFPNQRREASHTNSRTWVNERTQLQAEWAKVDKSLRVMGLIKDPPQHPKVPREMGFVEESPQTPDSPPKILGSPFVPKTFGEWIEQRKERANDHAKEGRQQLYAMQEHKLQPRHPDLPPPGDMTPITVAFGGKQFTKGRGAVLSEETIWTPSGLKDRADLAPPREERPEAPWPTYEEMKEEGNERNTSGYRRFLALPRVPGNDTVNWKQRTVLHQLPFDEIWRLPTRDTVEAQRKRTEPDEMEEMEAMIGRDLFAAIDCEVEPEYQEGK